MSDTVKHAQIYFTDYGNEGFGIFSPELPGLVSGGATMEDLSPEFVFAAARDAGLSADGSLTTHLEQLFEIEGDDFVVRVKQDALFAERSEFAERLLQVLHHDPGLRAYATADSIGNHVFVVTLDNDRLADVLASLDNAEPVTLVVHDEDDDSLDCVGILRSPTEDGVRDLRDLGLSDDSTVGDLLRAARTTRDATTDDGSVREAEQILVSA